VANNTRSSTQTNHILQRTHSAHRSQRTPRNSNFHSHYNFLPDLRRSTFHFRGSFSLFSFYFVHARRTHIPTIAITSTIATIHPFFLSSHAPTFPFPTLPASVLLPSLLGSFLP
jgi:hypothetical protein